MPQTLDDPWIPEDGFRSRAAAVIQVWKIDEVDGETTLTELPNVVCLSVEHRLGTDPGSATFRYAFDGRVPEGPQSAEEALDTNWNLPLTVAAAQRLAVTATNPSTGERYYIFSGEVLEFQLHLNPSTETVMFSAQGDAKRLADDVIGGMVVRDPHSNISSSVDDTRQTGIVARFNPGGMPNRTPEGRRTKVDEEDPGYHVFDLDSDTFTQKAYWYLSDAMVYLARVAATEGPGKKRCGNLSHFRHSEDDEEDKKNYGSIQYPDIIADEDIDPVYTHIPVSDMPITGRDVLTVMHGLLHDKGFTLRIRPVLQPARAADIGYTIDHLRNQGGRDRELWLQPRGETLDPKLTNCASISLRRDIGSVITRFNVVGTLNRHEVSFVLAPEFDQSLDDAAAANLPKWDANAIKTTPANRDKYRVFGVNETGNENIYWILGLPNANYNLEEPLDVADALYDEYSPEFPVLHRPRKPIGTLLKRNEDGSRRRATLHYSLDYTGKIPGVWDGTGTWKPITGSWELLEDRIGIRITADHPNQWRVGTTEGGRHEVLRLVEGMLGLGSGVPRLRLTCVVESDARLSIAADKRSIAALPYNVTRDVDASDRVRRDFVYDPVERKGVKVSSGIHSDDLHSESLAYQAGADTGILSGPAMIPYFTTYYELADRITKIRGRNLHLRTDIGTPETSEPPHYPIVESVRWDFDGGQRTTLFLSDESRQRVFIERKLSR